MHSRMSKQKDIFHEYQKLKTTFSSLIQLGTMLLQDMRCHSMPLDTLTRIQTRILRNYTFFINRRQKILPIWREMIFVFKMDMNNLIVYVFLHHLTIIPVFLSISHIPAWKILCIFLLPAVNEKSREIGHCNCVIYVC